MSGLGQNLADILLFLTSYLPCYQALTDKIHFTWVAMLLKALEFRAVPRLELLIAGIRFRRC